MEGLLVRTSNNKTLEVDEVDFSKGILGFRRRISEITGLPEERVRIQYNGINFNRDDELTLSSIEKCDTIRIPFHSDEIPNMEKIAKDFLKSFQFLNPILEKTPPFYI